METTQDVIFEVIAGKGGDVGIISLNRPTALNSLNLEMVHAMHAQLKLWASDVDIKAVIVRAVPGRAFCAGGDLRTTYESMQAKSQGAIHFFRDEYKLNSIIYHFPKPYIALLDGITMGGGVGISIHGSHRVATEKLMFAMPETGIGFFPDIGATYFLPRLSGKLGYYLGLTGARLNADDSVALGLAQYKVNAAVIPNLIEAIAQHQFVADAKASVSKILQAFQQSVASTKILEQQPEIDRCFSHRTMEEILASLQQASGSLCMEAAAVLPKKSPTSLKVSLRALQQGAELDFDTCMQLEYRLASHFAQGYDFKEGIRAVIIDKDQTPHWQPSTLAGVTEEVVERYFTPLVEERLAGNIINEL